MASIKLIFGWIKKLSSTASAPHNGHFNAYTAKQYWKTRNIQTIMFDMDGTLLDLAFDNFFWRDVILAQWATTNGQTLQEAYKHLTPLLQSHEGTLNWYSVDFWSSVLQFDVGQLKYQHRDKIKLRPKAVETLSRLQPHLELWLVTNADPIALNIKLQQTGIAPYFTHIISSNTLGYAKEQIQFWQTLQQKYPFDANTTLLVDDNPHVLKTAQQFGVAHLLDVHHPDSSAPAKTESEHPMLVHLDDLVRFLLDHKS